MGGLTQRCCVGVVDHRAGVSVVRAIIALVPLTLRLAALPPAVQSNPTLVGWVEPSLVRLNRSYTGRVNLALAGWAGPTVARRRAGWADPKRRAGWVG